MTATDATPQGCESRHLRWFGAIVSVVLVLCLATAGYVRWEIADLDARLRVMEAEQSANAVRFQTILQRLDDMANRGGQP